VSPDTCRFAAPAGWHAQTCLGMFFKSPAPNKFGAATPLRVDILSGPFHAIGRNMTRQPNFRLAILPKNHILLGWVNPSLNDSFARIRNVKMAIY